MGKKSRAKKQRRAGIEKQNQGQNIQENNNNTNAQIRGIWVFLLWFIRLSVIGALFTPLVLKKNYYFPFVGPKSLYFMGFCQVIFFAWLILAIYHKEYRPNINKIFAAFAMFLIVLTLSSALGVDFSRSFWSKFERMTGLLMWLHLFAWFLALSSTFKRIKEWRFIFLSSVSIATLISFFTLIARFGVVIYKQGGSSLGNSSFLGSYLLFNVFFALYLFFEHKNIYLRIFDLLSVILCGIAIYYVGARAATLGMLGGFVMIGLLYASFMIKRKAISISAKIIFSLSAFVVLISVIMLLIPHNPVSNKFIELTTASREVNWQMAWKGFLERPLLGWGPENYTVLFPKFFNPCLFTSKCGGEIWFDRTHNIIFDTLSTTGIIGLMSYLAIFVALGYALVKKHFKDKTISFWSFSVFSALLAAYFIQNLTVFDMVASLMLFILVVAFISFLSGKEKQIRQDNQEAEKTGQVKIWPIPVIAIIFLITFFEFVIQPLKTDAFVIKGVASLTPEQRVMYYKKAEQASQCGKYQIRDFFAQESQSFVRQNLKEMPKESLEKELNFVIEGLKKTKKECPIDFRARLKLAQVYNVYALLDIRMLVYAEQYGKEALALSPKNQQAYWSLTQTKVYQHKFNEALDLAQKAIDLEPELLKSHLIAIQVAQVADQYDKAKEFAEKAVKIKPGWADMFKDILSSENSATK